MQWPTLIVDNFFTDPHAVVKLSKTFKYTKASDNKWPGTRSPPVHEIDKDFFLWSTRKIMILLYPMTEYLEEKKRFYKDLKDRKRMEKYKDKANSKFSKKVELFSNFNRLVLFDSFNWHASRNSGDDKSDRLILITFFRSIACENIRYPVPQMRRI